MSIEDFCKEKYGMSKEEFLALPEGKRDAMNNHIYPENVQYATQEQLVALALRKRDFESGYHSLYNEIGCLIGFPLRKDSDYDKDGRVSSCNLISQMGLVLCELDPDGSKMQAYKERMKNRSERMEAFRKKQ